MKKPTLFLSFVLGVFLVVGCGVRLYNPVDETRSLVFGFIDMKGAPTKMSNATLKQVKPLSKKPYWYMGTNGKGLFWDEQLPPGSYQLFSFGGHSFWRNASFTYNMPEFGKNETAVVIKKPGLYYVGSYKFEKTGSFFNPKFDLVKTDSPSEKEILQQLLALGIGTEWEKVIENRIRVLK